MIYLNLLTMGFCSFVAGVCVGNTPLVLINLSMAALNAVIVVNKLAN